ncbi:hypothetical protein T11_9111 [Trichinella zimbabwensis]|uniref:Uncharacterized protein n=1 Tax=Trichinella zimbabwensis TaxID=268475 RepID=A0A0V1H2H8_9BILA|nr:hypothetical protein T11_9111 [Trichinella zimbabwensis]
MVRPDGTIPLSEFAMKVLIITGELSGKCCFLPPGFIPFIASVYESPRQLAVEFSFPSFGDTLFEEFQQVIRHLE